MTLMAPFGQETVGQVLELGGVDGGELAAQGDHDLAAGKGRRVGGQPVGAGQLIEHLAHCHAVRGELALAAGELADQPLGVDAALAGLGLQRPCKLSGVSWVLAGRVAWATYWISLPVRGLPSSRSSRSSSALICSCRLDNALTSSVGIPTMARLPQRSGSPHAIPSERVS
jgi:hypothetical protein